MDRTGPHPPDATGEDQQCADAAATWDEAPRHDMALRAGRVGNVARTLLVGTQTINMNGRLEWIQTMQAEELKTAEKRLRRAASQHEARAILPVLAQLTVVVLTPGVLKVVSDLNGWRFGANDLYVSLALGAIVFAFPMWLTFYDIRRRDRRVVEVAEARLAEVVVELALRQDPPPRIAPGIRCWRWLKGLRARRRE
jgi:hypothetical protein